MLVKRAVTWLEQSPEARSKTLRRLPACSHNDYECLKLSKWRFTLMLPG